MMALTLIPACSCEHFIKVDEDSGGRAPDGAAAVLEDVEADRLALVLARVPLPVSRIEQEVERHLEDAFHFARIGLELERRGGEADHRRDAKAGARAVVGKPPE